MIKGQPCLNDVPWHLLISPGKNKQNLKGTYFGFVLKSFFRGSTNTKMKPDTIQ